MKEKEYNKLCKYRRIGKTKYCLLWGLYFIVLINAVEIIGDLLRHHQLDFSIDSVLITTIISFLAGILTGISNWNRNESRFFINTNDNKN